MPSISVVSFSPHERFHLLLCELDDTMFIVDCGWPLDTLYSDQPDDTGKLRTAKTDTRLDPRDALSTINWARVDFIILSNYEQMALLPYITEYTEFSGPVYATEPAKAYGRCVLEEGLSAALQGKASATMQGGSSSSMASTSNRPQSSWNHTANGWDKWQAQLPYTQRDIVAAMEKITDVRHNEVISPVPFVQVYTRSSGYSIGSANWTVEYKNHRTAFISTSTFVTCLHPQEWDSKVLSDAQAIVFCDAVDPASHEDDEVGAARSNAQVLQRINQLCSTAISTMKQRGRVLLVGEPYGVTQDIFQLIAEHTQSLNLPPPQFIFISPVAERTLQYGNIMGEWLCESKQALLYLPEYPFADKDLRQKNHLHFVRSLADLATRNIPQGNWFVVVPPHDTATIDYFVRQWKQDAQRCSSAELASGTGMAKFAVLMHDDDVARSQSLVNRLTVSSEITYVPVSRRLTYHSIEQSLASATHAQHVLMPSPVYARLSASASKYEFKMFEYSHLQATTVDLSADRHLPLNIQKEMTQQIKSNGKQCAVVTGLLSLAAGKIRLEYPEGHGLVQTLTASAGSINNDHSAVPMSSLPRDLSVWTPEKLADELNEIGINARVVVDIPNGTAAASSKPELQSTSQPVKLIKIVVPGGSATIHMHGGWSVDCTSVSAQWTVMDSLRRVLKCA
ncbi:Integrator complex subunit 9 [Coemansia furcata]|uniref:Integrator complex subunit 9 n=1 Tax=Coemansia furcata TaxID=417177 RepID=A0ACC1LN80_9FUNG|nr:Integrator complex subunit 9 [Coemansia furcata]